MLAVFAAALMMSIVVIGLCVGVIYAMFAGVRVVRVARKRRRRENGSFGAA